MPIRLQPLARSRIEALGETGRVWLEQLPDTLAELSDPWQLVLGRGLAGGSAGYVVEATRADGQAAVLKLACVEDASDEMTVLRLADGQGYARMLECDPQHQALLLERLGPPLGAAGRSASEVLEILGATLTRAWQGVPVEVARPLLQAHQDKAARLGESIDRWWHELDRPCAEATMKLALRFAAELSDPPTDEIVVLHGDPHPYNALWVMDPRPGAESGYCFADPDGFLGDRAYDLGVVVRDWTSHLDTDTAASIIRGHCAVLAYHTGVDVERIWAWGLVERVSTGLYVASFGADRTARPFLQTADWIAALS